MLKLFRVTCWHDYIRRDDDYTFENFVIAENETHAKEIVDNNVWSLSGMEIKCVEEVDMTVPRLLCFMNTEDLE